MKQFFKMFFASMLGFMIGIVLLFFIFFIVLSAIVSSLDNKQVSIDSNSLLSITLDQPLEERSSENPFDYFDLNDFSSHKQPGLNQIITTIDKAAKDDDIKGIYLNVTNIQGGIASLEEIRNAILRFKKSGKFVFSWSESYSQGAYYLASVSDKIYLNPEGDVELKGLNAEVLFFKGMLDKLEIEPQIIRHGKFKSAIEPFITDKMSDENRAQTATFINAIWNNITLKIAESRKLNQQEIKLIADSLLVQNADDALQYKLVDRLAYKDEFIKEVNLKIGVEINTPLSLVSLNNYKNVAEKNKSKFTSDRIAVIYANGDINSGKGNEKSIGSEGLSKAIRDARMDDKIKAIVLRVNSPGGSALASEVIWREVKLAAGVKPTVVSMGDYAASGGYYISCAANKIVAQPNTLTGSIGVFGLLFNGEKMLKNKLGITTDRYKTGPYTDMGSFTRPMTNSETAIIQKSVNKVYDTFTKRVSDGRKLPQTEVDNIGQGRVWSGTDALKLHLVDTLGGINDAIAIAAKMAKLDNYRIKELPLVKDALEKIMEDFSEEAHIRYLKQELTEEEFSLLNASHSILKLKGIQAIMLQQLSIE